MPMLRSAILAACAASVILLGACQPAAQAPAPSTTAPSTTAPSAPATSTPAPPAPAAQMVTVNGLISAVADAGFPNFLVTIKPDGGGPPVTVTWMDGDDTVSRPDPGMQVEDFEGKRVALTYERVAKFRMEDLRLDGKSLLRPDPEYPIPASFGPEVMDVVGVLAAPDVITAGDLPDEMTVTGPDGKPITVEHFIIEDKIIAARGKTVKLFYSKAQSDEVRDVKLLP
jgi:hypothetical protein